MRPPMSLPMIASTAPMSTMPTSERHTFQGQVRVSVRVRVRVRGHEHNAHVRRYTCSAQGHASLAYVSGLGPGSESRVRVTF